MFCTWIVFFILAFSHFPFDFTCVFYCISCQNLGSNNIALEKEKVHSFILFLDGFFSDWDWYREKIWSKYNIIILDSGQIHDARAVSNRLEVLKYTARCKVSSWKKVNRRQWPWWKTKIEYLFLWHHLLAPMVNSDLAYDSVIQSSYNNWLVIVSIPMHCQCITSVFFQWCIFLLSLLH